MKNSKRKNDTNLPSFKFVFLLVLLLTVSLVGFAQKQTIKGAVYDSSNIPIIGASVLVKGTSNGTITNLDGEFTLFSESDETLVVSYIGYKTQEILASLNTTLVIILEEDTEVLDEVVVVGFGTQKKVNLTGSVGIADGKELESRPVMSATQALQGLVPGLQITTTTGELDKDMSINIRGSGTIGEGSSSSPLVLIDGMEGSLSTVNPQDIESISVLKDAAASSIYGSRAPFGVILVTTKTGKAGKISVNYNNSFRLSQPINLPEAMDSYTFANYFNSAFINNGDGQFFKDDVMQNMLDYQAGLLKTNLPASSNGQWGKPDFDPFTNAYANTDWYKEVYKSEVFSQEHNVSLTGGSEKINYYASFNYLGQSGLLRHGEDGLDRLNFTAKMNTTITDWMKFNYIMRFTRTDNYRPTYFGDSFYDYFGRMTWPNLPVYDPNGFYYDNGVANGNPAQNMAEGGDRNATVDRHYYQGALILEPIKNWITHVELNYSIMNSNVKELSLPKYNHDVNGNLIDTKKDSYLYQDHKKENYLNLNIYTEYSHSFLENHNMKIMAGFQAEEMKQDFFSVQKYGVMINGLPEFDLTTGSDGKGNAKTTGVKGNHNEWATAGFFGRLNYDYKGRYLAEINYRYDGTSRFRRGSRWQSSPSFSAGWNIANEEFWEPFLDISNMLKLRFSYGQLGNQNTTAWYPTYRLMNLGAYNGTWLNGGVKPNTSSVGSLVSTSLTWEKIRTWDVGLDFGLFNNRLTGTFDYYVRFTDNMVGPALELPEILGIDVPNTNNCDLKTQGWELALNWRDRLKNGLGYSIGLSVSDAVTYIESYPGNTTNSIDSYLAGRKMGEIWGFETIGIAKSDQEMQDHLAKVGGQSFGSKWSAGDIMYANIDGKPGITDGARTLDDHGDLRVIGNDTPRYFFGIDLNADWKGFDFRCFFQGVMKRDYWQSSGHFWGVFNGVWRSRGYKEHEDYFRGEPIGLPGHEIAANLDSYYPRPIVDIGTSNNQRVQTRYLLNASYIRLKNIQIGYTLPDSWMQKIGLSKCRVFISGENLWTGTGLSNLFDPETISGGNSNSGSQTYRAGNAYPLSKTWSFGLSITL